MQSAQKAYLRVIETLQHASPSQLFPSTSSPQLTDNFLSHSGFDRKGKLNNIPHYRHNDCHFYLMSQFRFYLKASLSIAQGKNNCAKGFGMKLELTISTIKKKQKNRESERQLSRKGQEGKPCIHTVLKYNSCKSTTHGGKFGGCVSVDILGITENPDGIRVQM